MLRLFESVAVDQAVSDTLYYLEKALQDGRMDLKSFLKVHIDANSDLSAKRFLQSVRRLARQQYQARALTNKINMALREQKQIRAPY